MVLDRSIFFHTLGIKSSELKLKRKVPGHMKTAWHKSGYVYAKKLFWPPNQDSCMQKVFGKCYCSETILTYFWRQCKGQKYTRAHSHGLTI